MRVLLVIMSTCTALGAGMTFKHLSVKYSATLNGYFFLPTKLGTAKKFQHVTNDTEFNMGLYSYPSDPRFFIIFDNYGTIAGLRIGFLKEDLPKRAAENQLEYTYQFEDHGMYESGSYWDKDVWYATVLFVDPDILKAGGRVNPKGVVAEDVYLKLEGHWTRIPRHQCDAERLGFTKQGCFLGMGQHYFYNMSESTPCKDLPGLFLLYESEDLIGLGFNPFGSFSSTDRTWFDNIPLDVNKKIMPNAPECLADWISSYGTSSIHIFFKRFPRFSFCLWPWQKKNSCIKM